MENIDLKQPTPKEQQKMHEKFMNFLRTNPNNSLQRYEEAAQPDKLNKNTEADGI